MSDEFSPKKQLETERGGSGRKGKTAVGSSDGGDSDDFQRWPGGQGDPRQAKRLRTVLCEPNELIRQGLIAMIKLAAEVIGQTDDGSAAVEMVREQQPDLLLLDPINSRQLNGMQICACVSKDVPKTRLLVCTDLYFATKFYHRLMRSGAHGIYMKAAGRPQLMQAITRLVRGENYCDPFVARLVKQTNIESLNFNRMQTDILIRLELSNKEIAEELNLKLSDVDEQVQYILKELQALTRTSAGQKAVRLGLVLLPKRPLVDPKTGLSAEQTTAERHAKEAIDRTTP